MVFKSDSICSALSSLKGLATAAGVTRNNLVAGLNRLSAAIDRDGDSESRDSIKRLRTSVGLLREFDRSNMVDGAAPSDAAFQMMVCKLFAGGDPTTVRFMREAERSYKLYSRAGGRAAEPKATAARACYNCGGSGHVSRDCPTPQSGAAAGRSNKRPRDTHSASGAANAGLHPPAPAAPMLTWPYPPAGPPRPPGPF